MKKSLVITPTTAENSIFARFSVKKMSLDLNHKSILITGGTGSFGRKFVETVLRDFPEVKRLVIFSRGELKQYEMAQALPISRYKALDYMLGDIRDAERIKRACEGIDYVIHAAALKHAPIAEHNPMEFIKTNVIGGENVINAALDNGVKKVVALSTDKAAAPNSLYGATKLCSDKLFVAANNMKGDRDITFSVVRYGNVMGSSGSVVPFFMQKRREGILPITHPGMTRFHISPEEGINLIFYALEHSWGGEIFVPKLPSYKITDLATAIGPDCEQVIIGIRPGEKLHEEMITESDAFTTVELDDKYVIMPFITHWSQEEFIKTYQGNKVPAGFVYNSGSNKDWLSVKELEVEVKKHLRW